MTDPVVGGIVDLTTARPPTLGSGRLVCVDGPAGSGKTTLAAALAALVPGTRVVHMDDLFPGWEGLDRVEEHVLGLLRPLAKDEPGRYRRFDWLADEYAEEHVVDPVPLLVLEGVGSWRRTWADLVTTSVWIEAPQELRLERGMARDGEEMREHWLAWLPAEAAVFAREQTRERADVRVDGTRGLMP